MRILFVGSLDTQSLQFDNIKNNFKELIKLIIRDNYRLLIRDVPKEHQNIPIDHIVYEALQEYTSSNGTISKDSLLIVKEPGVSSGIAYSIPFNYHSASTPIRVDFYKELLSLVDIVIGVGGELGLMRIAILSEYIMKPFLVLPGSGGTSDMLWHDFFRKSYQMACLTTKQVLTIKKMPFINGGEGGYAERVHDIIKIYSLLIDKGIKKKFEFITPNTVTIPIFFSQARKFSLSMWGLIIGILSTGCYIAYYIGKSLCKP